MNKKSLINKIANITKVPKTNVKFVLNTFTDVVLNTLQKGEFIKFSGFGKIYTRQLNTRKFISFQTGEEYTAPPRLVPAIKFSTSFTDRL